MRAKETQLSATVFMVQRADFIVAIQRVFLAARAVLLSMRASEDFGCAEKLSAAEQ